MSDTNIALWRRLEKTDPRYVTKYKKTGGFEGHAVKANHVAEFLTETFGPVGKGWGFEEVSHEVVNLTTEPGKPETPVWCVLAKVWVLDGNERLESYGRASWPMLERRGQGEKAYYIVDSDAPTKALTHAWKKGFSSFGVMADVFLGLMDDSEYVAERNQEVADQEKRDEAELAHSLALKQLEATLKSAGCEDANDKTAVVQWATGKQYSYAQVEANKGWPHSVNTKIQEALKQHKLKPCDILLAAKGQTA